MKERGEYGKRTEAKVEGKRRKAKIVKKSENEKEARPAEMTERVPSRARTKGSEG